MSVNVSTTNNSTVVSASGDVTQITVSGGVGPKGEDGAAGVSSVNSLVGAVTLVMVGGAVSVAGQTITFTVNPGVTSWNDLTDKPATFPPSTHTHVAADITDFTTAVVAAAPPTTNASLLTSGTLADARLSANVVLTTDARLSDARTPTSHAHGNITNAGAIGSTSGLPVITTTGGVVTVGSFGSTAGTFCSGNDARLSDARTPLAHNQAWSTITSTPTTLAGYGITDAAASTHVHGNITNAGAIGSASGLPIITTTSGVLTVGAFGTSAGQFCQGDDARLSDSRAPTGAAGGDLTGTYPNPTIAAGAVVTEDIADGAVTLAKTSGIQKTITSGSAAPTGGVSGDYYVQTAAAGQVTPATLSASANDYSPGNGDIYRLSASAAVNLTGWTAWTDGTLKMIVNVGSFAITLKHQSTSSSANNRFITPTAGDYVLSPGSSMVAYWDATDSRVRVF